MESTSTRDGVGTTTPMGDQESTSKVAMEGAKQGAQEVMAESKQQAKEVMYEAKDRMRSLVDRAGQDVRQQTDTQARRAATNLRTLSDQLRAVQEGRTQDAGPVVQWLGDASQRLTHYASRLESGGLDAVMSDVSRFARRRPGLFLLTAAGIGFGAGRYFKAMKSNDRDNTMGNGQRAWSTPGDGSYSLQPHERTYLGEGSGDYPSSSTEPTSLSDPTGTSYLGGSAPLGASDEPLPPPTPGALP
jgi:polyhydroxyalkanoate synthesis regulator phasin